MDTLLQNLRATRRRLRNSPGFAAAVILTLGLGVGVNTSMFSVVHAVLLAPLPYPDPDRLTFVGLSIAGQETRRPLSGPEVADLARGSSQQAIGAIWPTSGTLVEDDRPEAVRLGLVTANFLSILGVPPVRGRTLMPGDEGPGAQPVAVISGRLWQMRFGGADVIGRSIRLDGGWGFPGGSFTVVGVMPPDFEMLLPLDASIPTTVDAWIPFGYDIGSAPRSMHFLRAIGRVAPGTPLADAQREFERVGNAIIARFPYLPGRRFFAVPLEGEVVQHARTPLVLLQAAVLLVLLIACANVANLVLVRARAHRREIGVRLALGAPRSRLAGLLLTESLVLAAAGGLVGLALAWAGLRLLPFLSAQTLPRAHGAALSLPVLGYCLAATAGCGILFGLTSLAHARRADTVGMLRGVAQGGVPEARRVWRHALAVAEIGLSLVLLVGAGLLTRTFLNLHAVDPGYRWDGVLTFKLSLPMDRYGRSADLSRFTRALESGLRAVPGVAAAGQINQLPLDDTPNWAIPYLVRRAEDEPAVADARLVTPGYFETLEVELVEGRWITERDDENQPLVLLVDEHLARKAWPGADPLGQELSVSVATEAGFRQRWGTVVGVVGHQRHHHPSREVREQVFVPFAQAPRNQMAVVVRSQVEAGALMREISRRIAEIDPYLAPSQVRPLSGYVAVKEAPARFTMVLAGLFAGFSLLLACLGVYGVMSYSVAQRAPELGVRAALGADRTELVSLVLRRGAALTGAGLALGLVTSFGMVQSMKSLLFEVITYDPVTFAGAPVLLGLTALVACYIPARRAAAVDPVQVLRSE